MIGDEQPKPIESSGMTHGGLIDHHGALVGADPACKSRDHERMQLDLHTCRQFRLVQGLLELGQCRLSLPRLLRRTQGGVEVISAGTKSLDGLGPCSTLIYKQLGIEAQNVAALPFYLDFTVEGGVTEAGEVRELPRLLMNPRRLEMGKAGKIDTAQSFHLAFVHGGDVFDLSRFDSGQIIL